MSADRSAKRAGRCSKQRTRRKRELVVAQVPIECQCFRRQRRPPPARLFPAVRLMVGCRARRHGAVAANRCPYHARDAARCAASAPVRHGAAGQVQAHQAPALGTSLGCCPKQGCSPVVGQRVASERELPQTPLGSWQPVGRGPGAGRNRSAGCCRHCRAQGNGAAWPNIAPVRDEHPEGARARCQALSQECCSLVSERVVADSQLEQPWTRS